MREVHVERLVRANCRVPRAISIPCCKSKWFLAYIIAFCFAYAAAMGVGLV